MRAVFLRAIEANDKTQALRAAARGKGARFEAEPESFSRIPKSPFAYWVSARIRELFETLPPFESDGRTAKQGLATADDFRFVRLWWEVAPEQVGRTHRWMPFAKGGKYSPFYADVHLIVNWQGNGAEIKSNLNSHGDVRSNVWMLRETESTFFFRPGITWPRRTQAFGARALPGGCVFADKGPVAFCQLDDPHDLLGMLAILCSTAFQSLMALSLNATDATARSFEVGIVKRTPVPIQIDPRLSGLAEGIWQAKRSLEASIEISHVFSVPLIMDGAGSLSERAEAALAQESTARSAMCDAQERIDEICWEAYEIDPADQQQLQHSRANDSYCGVENESDDLDLEYKSAAGVDDNISALMSWMVGVGFGRFDCRMAHRDRQSQGGLGPFDALPVCSLGMLTNTDGVPVREAPEHYPLQFPGDGVMVDDQGNDRDLHTQVERAFNVVFDRDWETRLQEVASNLDAKQQNLRLWIARNFFEIHIGMYSRGRRKAPIYWQLGTPSGGYSIWLYAQRLTDDAFYRARELVEDKFRHEENRLTRMSQEAGPAPSGRVARDVTAQEQFVSELRTFREEVAVVAPLWNPDLNDGVVINCAPLWRLFPQNRSWQKECLKHWEKLVDGDYDWAHWAMHLWPERVVPKCAKDRSLAIAHGLEDVFWQEVDEGKWEPKKISKESINQLVAERTSPAVKDALQNLLDAPPPAGVKTKRRSRKAGHSV